MFHAVVDGVVGDVERFSVPLSDPGLLRGDGVFEVIRVYAGRAWALDEHLDRMGRSASNLRLPFPLAGIRADTAALLERAGDVDAFLRLVVTRGGQRIAMLEEAPAPPPSVALASVEYAPPRLLHAIKSLSYAANMLAVRIAAEQGADDALFVTDDGRLLEASRASLFYVLDGQLYTPPLADGILESITRRHIVEISAARERTTRLDDIPRMSEAFIASTTKDVLAVHAIDGHRMPVAPGPVTAGSAAGLRTRIAATLGLPADF